MHSDVCTRDIHKRVIRHSRNSRKFRLAKISKYTVYTYIYIYIYEHEAIQKPISENNIGAPSAPQKNVMLQYAMCAINKVLLLHMHI